MTKIDYEYETTEARVRAYLEIPEIERLRWLEELCVFTSMARHAPITGDARSPAADSPRTPVRREE